MTSNERLAAQIAKELIQSDSQLSAVNQFALGDDYDTELQLPAIVLMATLEDEEAAREIPKRYALKIELRSLRNQPTTAAADAIFARIAVLLNPQFAPARPVSLTAQSYYRIEKQTNAATTQADDTITRERSFEVWALFI